MTTAVMINLNTMKDNKLKTEPLPYKPETLSNWECGKYPFDNLLAWVRENPIKEEMIYKSLAEDQFVFVKNRLTNLLRDKLKVTEVISTHRSKSILLPVYHLVFSDGTEIIMRGNFYDWKITVCSPKDLNFPEDLFSNYMAHGQEKINSVYLEGFKDEWAFPLYGKDNKNRFTIEIKDEYELYTFFYLLKGQISVEEEIVISDSEKWAMDNKF